MLKFIIIISHFAIIYGELFPERFGNFQELYLPNEWSSVKDCPVRYYDSGRGQAVAPVAGQDAYEREFAHMAAIGWTQDDGKVNWNCGGSLISENYIVTAGHCAAWRGKIPDVARMGDLNLEIDTDNKWAQQLEIEQVMPHPQYSGRFNYYDIALIKLRGSIKVHDTVCPACLWKNETTRFSFLEACGYGQVGFLEEKTPKLQKVTLSPVDFESCKEDFPSDRKLPQGLQDHQMCAADRSHIQDTCLGDSGGPLQIKLLGKGKMHPFLIGITSFGKSCGTKTPGVYTRMSHFVDWIESVTGIETDPKKCAVKYSTFREFEPDVVKKSGGRETIDATKHHVHTNPKHLEYVVKIGDCFGNLLTEKFVLSSASCVKNRQIQKIITNDNVEIRVKAVTVHPKFSGIDNDIALIELQQEVEFNDDVRPTCVFSESSIPENHELGLVGLGTLQDHDTIKIDNYKENEPKRYLMSRSRPVNYSYCNDFYRSEGLRVDELTKICYGNPDYFLVPDTCQIAYGAPIERELYATDRYHSFLFGLLVVANDCGFGYPAIATRVSEYVDWIDSIIFKGTKNSEVCSLPFSGKAATCKRASECPHLVQEVRSGQKKLMDYICKFDDARNPLVCCPKVTTTNAQYNIENCPSIYRQHRQQGADENSHVALIGHGITREWRCRGYLISDKHVLTSVECVPQKNIYDVVALRHDRGQLYGINKVVTNEKTLSLITLDDTVSLSRKVIPICLWSDTSKIPFTNSYIPSKIKEPLKAIEIRPRPLSTCHTLEVSSSVTSEDQCCLTFNYYNFECTSVGSGVQYNRNETGLQIPYLIGVVHDVGKVSCNKDDFEDEPAYAFTKVASHYDWILAHVD